MSCEGQKQCKKTIIIPNKPSYTFMFCPFFDKKNRLFAGAIVATQITKVATYDSGVRTYDSGVRTYDAVVRT